MNVDNEEELVSVFAAPDETTASIVTGLLQSEGIDAMVQSRGGVSAVVGDFPSPAALCDVMVLRRDAERSLELIEAYHAEEPVSEEPEIYDPRYTERSHRSACGFMAALSVVGMAWGYFAGYTVWMIFASIFAICTGFASTHYLKTTPPRFHDAIRLYCLSYGPAGVALALAAANANGWVPFPSVLFYALCSISTVMFLRGAMTRIPEDLRRQRL